MAEKPKRKNAPPTPRSYWWIFGALAIVLLIGLRYPVRLTLSYQLNFLFYGLIGLLCLLALIRFIKHFHWRRGIVFAMLICILLVTANISNMSGIYVPEWEATCHTQHTGIFSAQHCHYSSGCYYSWATYSGVRGIPIAVRINSGWSGHCHFRLFSATT